MCNSLLIVFTPSMLFYCFLLFLVRKRLLVQLLFFTFWLLLRRRQWHPTPVLLPGESHGQRGLVGCSPRGREESDTTEAIQHACMHWRKNWQPTPVFLPGESQGQRSLVGCHLWGCTELDTTEVTQQQQRHLTEAEAAASGDQLLSSKINTPRICQQLSPTTPASILYFGLGENIF